MKDRRRRHLRAALALGVVCTGAPLVAAMSEAVPAYGLRPSQVASSTWTSPGYWLATARGDVVPEGAAQSFGNLVGKPLGHPIVAMASTPTGQGYWLAASDGGVFTFGDAGFFGSAGGRRLSRPIVAMSSTPDGRGYWLVSSDGGIFTFGDAGFFGAWAAMPPSSPIVSMASTPSGLGYWMLTAVGTVRAFGDARSYGSAPGAPISPSAPIPAPSPTGALSAIASSPTGHGYWLLTGGGRVTAYGDAPSRGSTPPLAAAGRAVGLLASPDGGGYLVAGADGGAFGVGDYAFRGRSPEPGVVAVAAVPPSAPAVVSAFYYPWFASQSADGEWRHWNQNGHGPPTDIGSDFYPARGAYSSSDASVVSAQMAEMAGSGINQIIVSWWGRGSFEDEHLALVEQAAAAHGLRVAVHIEPYTGRTAASVGADIHYLHDSYGTTDFYVYRSQDFAAADWAPVLNSLSGMTVWAESFWDWLISGKVQSFATAAGFSGVYTYDPYDLSGTDFAAVCGAARMDHLLCSPSVAPGFSAVRATGGTAVRPRRNGATYDQMWQGAIDSQPDEVSITSYNEWHEGSQIEPAVDSCLSGGFCYQSYDGAYGLSGSAAPDAYLLRTQQWAANYRGREAAVSSAARLTSAAARLASSPSGVTATSQTSSGQTPAAATGATSGPLTSGSWAISTVPGTGAGSLSDPVALAVDPSGDLYIADAGNSTVWRLAAGSSSLVRWAGSGSPGFGGDGGPAVAAQLDDPRAVALDSAGDLFIADFGNDRVREVNATTGDITTLAGGGGFGLTPEGAAAAGAALEGPSGVAVEPNGLIVFSETDANLTRDVDPQSGVLGTVAGDGAYGDGGDGGPGPAAQLAGPSLLAVNRAGDLFVSEPGSGAVRRVQVDGVISTVAGTGTLGDAGDNGPALSATLDSPLGVGVDPAGDVIVSEPPAQRIREVGGAGGVIYPVAGTGAAGVSADTLPALSSSLHDPEGLAVDPAGTVYVADTGNHRVVEFSPPAPQTCPGRMPQGSGVAVAAVPGTGAGYQVASSAGAVAVFGGAACQGSLIGVVHGAPVVAEALTPDGNGYWLASSNGGVAAFGDAAFYGSAATAPLASPVVGMAATTDGKGYWLVAADGGVFSFGDAAFEGSAGGTHLNRPIVGMAPTTDGAGYWLVAADGGIFTYGDAGYHGSTGAIHLNRPIVGMAPTPDGAGYWLVAADGGIFTYGDAGFLGSAGGGATGSPVVGMARTLDGRGYWLVTSNGGVLTYGDAVFAGSAA